MGANLDNTIDKAITIDRATAAPTSAAIFTIAGGRVKAEFIGEVTTVIQTQDDNVKLVSTPTVGVAVDLCAVNNITADAVGTMYTITGNFADALQATTSGAIPVASLQSRGIILAAGTVDLNCSAVNTGSIKWTCIYEPIDAGAYVVPA